MKHKLTTGAIWLILIVTAANCFVSVQQYQSRRASKVNISDEFNFRLTVLANAKITAGPAVGKGAKVSINGNDAIGQINIETGTSPQAGDLVHVTFTTPYTQ